MAYNSTLAAAMHHLEWTADANSTPTSTQATVMWTAVYLDVLARLSACGVTISASDNDKTVAAEVEALLTSAKVGESNEIQTDVEVSDHTKWLKEEGMKLLDRLCGHDYAEALGASVSDTSRTLPCGLAVDFPNDDLDTSEYESPLFEKTWNGESGGAL
tara:strand:+ start:1086 stop:1562 length:477 start_codon:yes stop_codon:yes gene_type:complete